MVLIPVWIDAGVSFTVAGMVRFQGMGGAIINGAAFNIVIEFNRAIPVAGNRPNNGGVRLHPIAI